MDHTADTQGGQGRVLNQDGVFRGWREARWVTRMGGDVRRGFELDSAGSVRVKEAGVYFIYSQVECEGRKCAFIQPLSLFTS